jgi:hypothetical protein
LWPSRRDLQVLDQMLFGWSEMIIHAGNTPVPVTVPRSRLSQKHRSHV